MAAAIRKTIETKVEALERARAEFNFDSIQPYVPRGSRVLDVGAWACYLGELLKDRLGCKVLSVDVTDANKTSMPFQLFNGKTLPVESGSFDVALLLYVLHHAQDDDVLLREVRRACSDEGCVVVAEDLVDGLWNRFITVGFHIWLKLVSGLGWDGRFRKTLEWRTGFERAGFQVDKEIFLGRHLGRRLWPQNVLFILRPFGQYSPRQCPPKSAPSSSR